MSTTDFPDGTEIAPAGHVWVCLTCGKTSKSRYGFDADGKRVSDHGWDESCMLNSELFDDLLLVRNDMGRVVEVKEHGQ